MPITPPWSVSTTQGSRYLSGQKLLLWRERCSNSMWLFYTPLMSPDVKMNLWTCMNLSIKCSQNWHESGHSRKVHFPPIGQNVFATKGTRERNWTSGLTDDGYAKARQKICWLISFIKPKITPLKNPDFMNKSNAFIKETFTAIFYTLF